MAKREKEESVFIQEVKRDIGTFMRLNGKRRIKYLYDYFRWKILAAIVIIIVLINAGVLLWQGQKPVRLRVCVVLNNEEYCSDWFSGFIDYLRSDGNKDAVEVDQDQPFDYNNSYSYLHEMEVMTKIASMRIDAAICGPDMYSYVLSLSATADLEAVLPDSLYNRLDNDGMDVSSVAGIKIREDGTEDLTDSKTGIFAIDITNSAFGERYNKQPGLSEDESPAPLYFVIISNTAHMEDSIKLLDKISQK